MKEIDDIYGGLSNKYLSRTVGLAVGIIVHIFPDPLLLVFKNQMIAVLQSMA